MQSKEKPLSTDDGQIDPVTVSLLHGTPVPVFSEPGFECLQRPCDPKGGELCHSMTKPWETVVEVSSCSDVQIV